MTAKIVHAFRMLNGQEAKVNSISKMIDGKMVLVWPLASPFYLDFNTLFGIPIGADASCAESILAKLQPVISVSPQAMLELMASDRLKADIQNATVVFNEPSLHPASPDMFFGGTSLVQDTSVVLREPEKSENALPIPSISEFMAALKPVKNGNLNGVQPVSVEFLPLLSPAEKTSSEDTQATISHTAPKVLGINDLAINENHLGIFDGEPILATIIDANNDKVDPFLFHGDALVAEALVREGEQVDPLLAHGTLLAADGLLTESNGVSPTLQESITKIAKSRLLDTSNMFPISLLIEPYTPVGVYGEQKVVQPMAAGLILQTVRGQELGYEKPTFYLLQTGCDIDLYSENEAVNKDTGAISIVVEYKAQDTESAEAEVAQSSNTQVEPTSTLALERIVNVSALPVSAGTPRMVEVGDSAASRPNVLTIFHGVPTNVEVTEMDGGNTYSVFQKVNHRQVETSHFDTKQAVATSVFAIPYTPVINIGDGQSTPSVTGHFYPELVSAQSEGRDTPTLYSSMVRCGFDLHEPEFFDSVSFGAVENRAEYRLVDPLVQYNMTTVGAEHNILHSLREKTSLQTDYLPSTAFPMLLLDQRPIQPQHTVDTFGAYGVSNIQYREILRFTNSSTVGGMSALLLGSAGIYEEKETSAYGGYGVTEPELRDGLFIATKGAVCPSVDIRPEIRLPIEASCGAALMGANRMEHTPNVLEVVDLDSAHITTVDLLSIEEIDLWPVRTDNEENYFRYQF